MASQELWFDEAELRPHEFSNVELDRIIGAQVGKDVEARKEEVREKVKATLGKPRTGGANGVRIWIPQPPATGEVTAAWGSKPSV